MNRRGRGGRDHPASKLVPLALVALAAAGCGGSHGGAGTQGHPQARSHASTPEAEASRARAEAASTAGVRADTSQAATEIRFAVTGNPRVGEPFTLTAYVFPTVGATALRLEVPPADGLAAGPVTVPLSYTGLKPDSILTVPLTFTADAPGVKIVTVVATESSANGPEAASYSFPVVVDVAALLPPPPADPAPAKTAPAPAPHP